MKHFINKKNQGYTLVEILLVITLIVLATLAIYSTYNKKRTEALVKNQSIYLEQIDQGLNGIFSTTNNIALLTPANVISARAVPTLLINSPTEIRNLFGGTIQFNATAGIPAVGATPAVLPTYGMVLDNIPAEVCALLGNSDFGNASRQLIVNGTQVRATGTVVDSTSIAAVANRCTNPVANTVEFRNNIQQISDINYVDPALTRTKENPYYIPTTGLTVLSPSLTCTGGSSWNGSFCGCPANSGWDGSANGCVVYGSKPGFCAIGMEWNGLTCVNHSIAGPGGIYQGGRNIPNLSYANEQVQQSVPNMGCYAANTTPGVYNNTNCETCANGAWNGFRCVTP